MSQTHRDLCRGMSYPPSLPSRKGGGCIHPARCVHSDLTTAVSWSGLAGTAGRGCQSLAPPAIAAAAAEPRFEAPNTRKNRWEGRHLPTGRYAARCMGRGTEERAQSGAAQTMDARIVPAHGGRHEQRSSTWHAIQDLDAANGQLSLSPPTAARSRRRGNGGAATCRPWGRDAHRRGASPVGRGDDRRRPPPPRRGWPSHCQTGRAPRVAAAKTATPTAGTCPIRGGGAEPRGPPTHTPALAAPTLVARGGAAPAPPLFPVPYPSSESAMCAGGPLGGRPRSLTCPGWCRHRPHLIFLGSVAARSSPPPRARAAVPAQPRGRGGRQCRLSGALPRRAAAPLLVGAAQSSARGRRRPGRLPPFSAFFSVFFGGWGGDHPSLRAGVGVCAAPPLSGALPRLPLGVSRAPAGVGVDGGATHSGRRCALRLGWRGCAD